MTVSKALVSMLRFFDKSIGFNAKSSKFISKNYYIIKSNYFQDKISFNR